MMSPTLGFPPLEHCPEMDGLMVDLGFNGRFGVFWVAWLSTLVDWQLLR